jgi:Tfp pilus assembly protein PilF
MRGAMLEKAIELDPQFAEAHAQLSHTYHRDWIMGWSHDPYSYTFGHVHFLMRRYDDALKELNRVVSRNPDWFPAHGFLAATYAELGCPDQARAEMQEALRISPAVLTSPFIERLPYEDPAVLARVVDAFRTAGLAPPSQ